MTEFSFFFDEVQKFRGIKERHIALSVLRNLIIGTVGVHPTPPDHMGC